jgi:hypothetical protein
MFVFSYEDNKQMCQLKFVTEAGPGRSFRHVPAAAALTILLQSFDAALTTLVGRRARVAA